MSFFGAVTASRFRTLSDPLKTRKSRRRSKYTHVGDIFQSQSDVSQRNSFSSTYLASYQECEHGRAGLSLSVSDNIPTSPQSPDSGRLDMTPKRKSFPRGMLGSDWLLAMIVLDFEPVRPPLTRDCLLLCVYLITFRFGRLRSSCRCQGKNEFAVKYVTEILLRSVLVEQDRELCPTGSH